MRVDLLVPDAAPPRGPQPTSGNVNSFAQLVDAAGALLERADRAESAFAAHRGGLQEMVVERARADIAVQLAASAAQRATQSLATLLGMQI